MTDEQLDAIEGLALLGQEHPPNAGATRRLINEGPGLMLALLAEVRQLRADLAGAQGGRDGWQSRAMLAEGERDRLAARVAQLEGADPLDVFEGKP